MSEYMGRLKQAGYSEKFRVSTLNQAMARFKGMTKAHMEGTCPLYRDSNWERILQGLRVAQAAVTER